MTFIPERVVVEERALTLPLTRRVLARLPGVPVEVTGRPGRALSRPGLAFATAKRTLIVALRPEQPLRTCRPSADYELPLGLSCPGLCQYCYLQGSLGPRPYVRVYADLDRIMAAATEQIAARAGEVSFEAASTSDPIAVEHLTGALAELIAFFGRQNRARLRLVTKFAYTEDLVGLPHSQRTRIRYSLNTPHVVQTFEAGTAPIHERIAAANRLGRAGYPVGFVLAPLMIYDGWQAEYESLLRCLASALAPELHASLTFELISHRFTARTKEIIRARFPHCRLDLDETLRQIKWGRYGHKRFIYPPAELRLLWQQLHEGIARHFPTACIEYST